MKASICSVLFLGVAYFASVALAVPTYDIIPLGLTGPEHTRDDGYQYSSAYRLNGSGQVVGSSDRYNGGSADLGRSAWLYDGTKTIDISLTGPEYTRSDGYRSSYGGALSESGQVSGTSQRYKGSTDFGRSAWLYDGAMTIAIGLTGPEHTRSDGYRYSDTYGHSNNAGQVSGESWRYNGDSTRLGQSAWLYDGGTTIEIGLTGPEYTRSDGSKYSRVGIMNQSGQVTGYSNRYNGSKELGATAWLYNGATTVEIGLTGPEYTRNDGFRRSAANVLNQSGQASGSSERFNGSTYLGKNIWIYDGMATISIGLTGPEHTRSDGYQDSWVSGITSEGWVGGASERYNGGNKELGRSAWLYNGVTTIELGPTGPEYTRGDGFKYISATGLNRAGQTSGTARRFSGSTDLGQSTWLSDGAVTIEIGLNGPEHVRSDGLKFSSGGQLNDAGQLRGISYRYKGSTDWGRSAWFYDGATTMDIGLNGSAHTRRDGYKYSYAEDLNEAGQVTGYSRRYNGGGTDLGQDAWLYDSSLAQTFPLQLSSRGDGYAYSSVEYLNDSGLVLGEYRLFDAWDNDLGLRAFYFTVSDGLHDLGSLVDGGLAANDWDLLASAFRVNAHGQILGQGKLTSQSDGQMAYLLTPVVPEPSTLFLATCGAVGWLSIRRSANVHQIGSRGVRA